MSDLAGFSVLLVDDHPLFREGLMLALAQRSPALHCHAVASLQEALQHVAASGNSVDLVLFDYRLPGEDGLACARKLRLRFPQIACALMSGSDDASLPTRVREAGLVGYFPKTLDVDALLEGLACLARGETFYTSGFAALSASSHEGLTPRQHEILRRVADGATNKEIAQLLQIAPHTVKNHLAQIFDRLGASNRAQAVSMLGGAKSGGE